MQTIFAAHLREKRKALGLSQAKLARLVGCSATYVWKIESCGSAPTNLEFLLKLADALNLSSKEKGDLIANAEHSQVRIKLTDDTSFLAQETINLLARNIHKLKDSDLQSIKRVILRAHDQMKG